ncbi:MAG TPA: hypothetical protein VK207_03445 [Bacteroidales bacterium]|nr:hypothetical protein [Bacteroidales bacterium]
MLNYSLTLILLFLLVTGCKKDNNKLVYRDIPFKQDYSVKYYLTDSTVILNKVVCDRNNIVQILTSEGLMHPVNGKLLYPGKITEDHLYQPVSDKKISGICTYLDQLVYCDDKAVLSNAWAGKLYSQHSLPGVKMIESGHDYTFMISDGNALQLIKNGVLWEGSTGGEIKDLLYDESTNSFWILDESSISIYHPGDIQPEKIFTDTTLTCFALCRKGLIAGTTSGYHLIDTATLNTIGSLQQKLPCPELTCAAEINDNLWIGSSHGAMMIADDGKISYYASERWLPSDSVIDISKGPANSVMVLTGKGLAMICFDDITLQEKAVYFENQVRERHIRNGFNATLSGMNNGDVTTGSLEDSDNDGLWTSMYLAAETFRYNITHSDEALQNIRESLDAMERLYTINPVPGFPARSFERRGYKYEDKAWRRADDPEWDWKSTTSSDEAIGHIFAFGVIAELIDEPEVRNKAVILIDTLMSHILKNDLYLVDWDGKPTRWGRWNPDYVNAFPEVVGDRKLNSSNIIAMLQTAYRFTGKEKYRKAAFQLMTEHGYLKNLLRPMKGIGVSPENSDDLSRLLSEGWNHSDDEMYFLGYWGLYRYAFNDTLKRKYRDAIRDHWQAERPEKDGLWNIMASMTLSGETDLSNAVWYLKEYPVDLVEWDISNSGRKDIDPLEANFRVQTTKLVLPPDELPILRHNANRFILNGGNGGTSEMSAGDIWLLPYWMGRYFRLISSPASFKP